MREYDLGEPEEGAIKELCYATTHCASFKLDFGLLLSPGTPPSEQRYHVHGREYTRTERQLWGNVWRPYSLFASIKHK